MSRKMKNQWVGSLTQARIVRFPRKAVLGNGSVPVLAVGASTSMQKTVQPLRLGSCRALWRAGRSSSVRAEFEIIKFP